MRITKLIIEVFNGIEVIKSKYLVTKDIDFQFENIERKKALYQELSKLLNL